jgi:Flp pilus assembly pilin Flp
MFEYLKTWLQLHADRRGITALEYAAIAGVLVAVVVTAATTLGGDISNTLVNSGNNL